MGSKSRTERHRKTKISTEVANVTRDSDTSFKVKRSRSPGRFTHRGVNASASSSGERGNVLSVGTYCYVAVCRRGRLGGARRFAAHRGSRRAGHIVAAAHPPTACFKLPLIFFGGGVLVTAVDRGNRLTYWIIPVADADCALP